MEWISFVHILLSINNSNSKEQGGCSHIVIKSQRYFHIDFLFTKWYNRLCHELLIAVRSFCCFRLWYFPRGERRRTTTSHWINIREGEEVLCSSRAMNTLTVFGPPTCANTAAEQGIARNVICLAPDGTTEILLLAGFLPALPVLLFRILLYRITEILATFYKQ